MTGSPTYVIIPYKAPLPKKGCGIAFVIDENMKNHRYVCAATHAGYAEVKG